MNEQLELKLLREWVRDAHAALIALLDERSVDVTHVGRYEVYRGANGQSVGVIPDGTLAESEASDGS